MDKLHLTSPYIAEGYDGESHLLEGAKEGRQKLPRVNRQWQEIWLFLIHWDDRLHPGRLGHQGVFPAQETMAPLKREIQRLPNTQVFFTESRDDGRAEASEHEPEHLDLEREGDPVFEA